MVCGPDAPRGHHTHVIQYVNHHLAAGVQDVMQDATQPRLPSERVQPQFTTSLKPESAHQTFCQ